MPEGTSTDPSFWKSAALAAVGLWLAFLSWFSKRQVDRTDDHDKALTEKVDRTEYNGTIESLRREIQTGTDQLRTEMQGQHQRLADQLASAQKEQRERDDRMLEAISRHHD